MPRIAVIVGVVSIPEVEASASGGICQSYRIIGIWPDYNMEVTYFDY
jgi:hypothetical protein